MFGTLVSTNFGQGNLEFVENQDPNAALSFNIRHKIHISCTFCRSRKIGCSGERSGCQRCTTMGLECVYPAHRGRIKRQEKNNSRCVATQRDANVATQMTSDRAEPGARKRPRSSEEDLSLDSLQNITFDNDNCIDESLFEPWIMNTATHYGLEGGSTSRSSSTDASPFDFTTREVAFSLQSSSATMALPGQQPEVSTVSTPLTSSGDPSPSEDAGELELWEEARMAPDSDMSGAMSVDGHSTTGWSPEALPLEPGDKKRPKSSSCRCLLSSISFLERLVSGAASCESRMDRLLGDVREAIETLAKFMACERCVAQVELNIVLAMAARQISVICGKVAHAYKAMHMMTSAVEKSSARESQQRPGPEDPAGPVVEIFVSTYRVNQRERLYLLKSLVTLQITELQQHIDTMVWQYRNRPNPGQAGALREAKNQIKLAQMAISNSS
ncbi:hypothetical protein F5Y12DRAFT_763117 [Xylaria sp. FL1777]|nr:hypothetical protein F5Y12DRAFT_763117 [Xylaria sp. FL1777]